MADLISVRKSVHSSHFAHADFRRDTLMCGSFFRHSWQNLSRDNGRLKVVQVLNLIKSATY